MLIQLEHWTGELSGRQEGKTWKRIKVTSEGTIEMKVTEQYFHVVVFVMLYKVVLTFKSVDETLVCDHLNESH